MGIALQPVPRDMARVVHVVCNDCETSDRDRRWHFLGVRCHECLSFNTTVEQIVLRGLDAADYLDQLEARRSGTGGVPANISVQVAATAAVASTNNNRSSSQSLGNYHHHPHRQEPLDTRRDEENASVSNNDNSDDDDDDVEM